MRIALLCVVLLLHGWLYSQPPLPAQRQNVQKPFLFASLPAGFEVSYPALEKLISADSGAMVTVRLADEFVVEGKMVYKGQTQAGTFSFNLKLANYNNALFNISLRLNANNTTTMRGRIIHPRFGDALTLSQQNGRYYLKKTDQRLLMPE